MDEDDLEDLWKRLLDEVRNRSIKDWLVTDSDGGDDI